MIWNLVENLVKSLVKNFRQNFSIFFRLKNLVAPPYKVFHVDGILKMFDEVETQNKGYLEEVESQIIALLADIVIKRILSKNTELFDKEFKKS